MRRSQDPKVAQAAAAYCIEADVAMRGDEALLESPTLRQAQRTHRWPELEISTSDAQCAAAWEKSPHRPVRALPGSRGQRIRTYARHQQLAALNSRSRTPAATKLGQRIQSPLDRATPAIYVPGGKAAWPVLGADECDSGQSGRCR